MKLRTKTRSLRVLSAILAMSLAIGTTGWMPIAAENEDVQAEAFAGRELWAPETEEEAAPPNTEGDLSPAQLQTAQLSPEEIPEAVSKEDIAERGHVHRLWKQEEDANSIVFQNRDGTKTLYYFTEAVKYVDENGAVQDKSNTLQDIGSASSASGYRYVNGFNDIKTYFPAQLGSGTGLLLKHGDIQIELTPAHAQRGETAEAGGPAEEEPADPEEAESADVPEDTAAFEDTAAEAGEAAGTTPTSSAVPFEAADDAAALAFPEENSAAASIPASDPSPVLPSPTAMESEETAPTGPSGTMPGTTEAGTAAADNTAAFPETTRPAEPTLPPVPEAAVDNAPILAKHSVPAEKKTADPDGHTADTVEYAEVFGEHTALRYSPTFSGFKEDIVLSENIGRNEFTFELQTGGLSLAQEGETVGLFDPLTGERVAMLDNILVFDSGGPAADEGEEIVPRHHYYRVETVEPDALYRVTVVVDEAFLNDPGTVYPVVIDPAITLTGSSGGIEDATIYSNYLVNEGSSGSVFVGSYNARYGSTRGVARTLVKIPASALSGIQASQITSAKLYYRDLMCEGDAVRIDCYPLTANWTESTVKCNAAIWTATGSLLSYQTVKSGNGEDGVGGPSGGHWYGFDITTAAKTWINTGNYYGVMLRANVESGAAKTFASANRSSYQPQLVVDYNAGHVAVSQVCLSATSLTMRVGSTANLTATIVPSNATDKGIIWETTDESIVGVGETGLLCAKKVGTVTITARAEDNPTKVYERCVVTVMESYSYRDKEVLNPEDYATMVALEAIYAELGKDNNGNSGVCDELLRTMSSIRNKSEYSGKYNGYYNCSVPNKSLKTAKVRIDKCYYVTEESIEKFHDSQPTIALLISLIPGCGPLFSALYSITAAAEQQDPVDISNAFFGEALGAAISFLKNKVKYLGVIYDAIQGAGALNDWLEPSGKDSYVVDGHRVYAGDAFVQVTVQTSLGLITTVYEVWLRNDVPIVTRKYGGAGSSIPSGEFGSYEQGIQDRWKADGYVTEEEYRNG